jgi:STAS domain
LEPSGVCPATAGRTARSEGHPDYERIPDVLVLRLEASLFYANATPIRDHIKTLVGSNDPPPTARVFDIGGTGRLDVTSTELVHTMHSAGIDVALADVRQPVIRMARRAGLARQLGDDRLCHTIDDAIRVVARGNTALAESRGPIPVGSRRPVAGWCRRGSHTRWRQVRQVRRRRRTSDGSPYRCDRSRRGVERHGAVPASALGGIEGAIDPIHHRLELDRRRRGGDSGAHPHLGQRGT